MNTYDLSERRITNKLCEYWNSLRNNRNYPALNEISEDEISDIWPHCFIIVFDSSEEEIKYKVYHMGTIAFDSFNSIFKTVQEDEVITNIKTYLDEVSESNEPIIEESEYIDGYETVRFRQCFLPLSTDNNNIDAVIGAVRYKPVNPLN